MTIKPPTVVTALQPFPRTIEAPNSRLRLHYCLLKAGPTVGVGETGAGFCDFTNWIALGQWIQEHTDQGIVVSVLAIRNR